MRIAAAIQWYHQRLISQSKGAAIAGLSRRDFLTALNHAKVEASQVDIEEMKEDVERDLQSRRERLASDLFDQSGAARSATGAECPSPGA
jgi:predicted HTH domain antitoxin